MEYNIQHMRQRHLNQPTHGFLTVKFYLAIVLILTLHTTDVLGSTLGSKCQHDMDCTDFIKGSSCSAQGYCECAPYFVQFNTTSCLSSQLLGGDCTLNEQCTMKVSNSSCLDGACRCVEGFLQFRKHTCLGPASPGSVCYSHAHCQMYSTSTHCDFLIPNLFGRCQCTAPAKLKNGICVDSSMEASTTEAAVELPKTSTTRTTSSTTTTTTSTTPAPVKETEAPTVHVEEVIVPQQILADPIVEDVSVEEQEWEDDRDVVKPSEILTDVKLETSTQQMPLTPAQIPELQEPVVAVTENVDIPNVTDDYPYKIEEEYNEEPVVPQQIADVQKEEEIQQEEQPTEDYGNAMDNTMNFDYGTAQHEMEQELEDEQTLMQQESELQQAHVAASQSQLTNEPEEHVLEEETIKEQQVDVVPELEETIVVPTQPPTADVEESLSDSLISQSLTNEIHHQHDHHLAEEEDEVVAENESVQNENESTAQQQQQQQPEAELVNDEVITTQPAIADVVAEVEEDEDDDEVENESHKIQEQQQSDANNEKTDVENNELEKLENQQIDENITEGHVADSSVEQQQPLQETLDETTVKMPEEEEDIDIDDEAELQMIEDVEKQEEHIDILTEQPEKLEQPNLDIDNKEQEQEIEEINEVVPEVNNDQTVSEDEHMEEYTTLADILENPTEDEEFEKQPIAEETQIFETESENDHQNVVDEEQVTEMPLYFSENVDNEQAEQITESDIVHQVEQITEQNGDSHEQEPLEQHEETIALQEVEQEPLEQHEELQEVEHEPLEQHEETIALQGDEQHEDTPAVQEDELEHLEQHVLEENEQEPIEQHEEIIALQEDEQHEDTAAVQQDEQPLEQHALQEDEQHEDEHTTEEHEETITLQQEGEESTAVPAEEQIPIEQHEETVSVPEEQQTPIEQHEEFVALQEEEQQTPVVQHEETIASPQEEEQHTFEQHEESIDVQEEQQEPIVEQDNVVEIEQQQLEQEEEQKVDEEKLDEDKVLDHLDEEENKDEMEQTVFEPVSLTQNEEENLENNEDKVDEVLQEVQHVSENEETIPQTIDNELTDSLDHEENFVSEEQDNLEKTTMAAFYEEPKQEEAHEAAEQTLEIENITEQNELFEESTQSVNEVEELQEVENEVVNQIESESQQHDSFNSQNELKPEYVEDQQQQIVDAQKQEEVKDETQNVDNSPEQEESESHNNQGNEMVHIEDLESVTESIAHDLESEINQHSDASNDEVPVLDEKIEDNEIAETEHHEIEEQQISPDHNNIENPEIENAVDSDLHAEDNHTEIPNEEFFSLVEKIEDNVVAETDHQEAEQHVETEAQQVSPESNNIENNEEHQEEIADIENENQVNGPQNSYVNPDQQVENQDLDRPESEEFKESESISDILNDLMKEEVTVQPDFFEEMENNFDNDSENENNHPEEVPDLIAEDSNISEEKVISEHLPVVEVEGTEGPIDPEDKLITFYPDMQEMQKQEQHHHQQVVDINQEEDVESSGDYKPTSQENEIVDHPVIETEKEEHRTLSPLELPFDTSVDYRPQELESDNLVVETTTLSSGEIKTEENEQAEATTTAGDIAELTTQTMLNLASRVTLMEPAAPISTTLRPLMTGDSGHDEVTAEPAIDAPVSEMFLTTKPTTEIRKRVELSLEAVSLGLKCSTNKQCQLADPHTVCNAQGVCDCAASTYAHSSAGQCGAERTGCAPGTFQCRSSGVCISWFFVCDGRSDCNDASDEECTFNARHNQTCPTQAFQCGQSGRCISRAALCDGRKQCPHGEDEMGCNDLKSEQSCPPHTFRCKSGECLPEYEYCNAIISCRDGSDEPPHLCGSRSMPNFFLQLLTAGGLMNKNLDANAYCPHRCSNGRCRSTAIVCSGRDGCGDGTDEQTCSVCRCPAVNMNKPPINVSDFLARRRPMPLW